ncbi:MAG TPA: 6,7-dimethyl-8-ribityllumazine synthase [Dehalococcoidia bacterium]|nr:6,7-dimethyl-8-ribityllumazine synthase [Dehalococcoidia bacterium]
MGSTIEGRLDGSGLTIAIVVGRFNDLVTERLLAGARSALERHGVSPERIDVVWVPGSFEIPGTAKLLAASGRYSAVICLGAVIRGGTPHFDYVAGQAAAGILRAGLDTNVPVVFGVLTTDTIEQALDRAGLKSGNKGYDAAVSAIEMASVYRQLRPD